MAKKIEYVNNEAYNIGYNDGFMDGYETRKKITLAKLEIALDFISIEKKDKEALIALMNK